MVAAASRGALGGPNRREGARRGDARAARGRWLRQPGRARAVQRAARGRDPQHPREALSRGGRAGLPAAAAKARVSVSGPRLHLGTSGFSYPAWKGSFYPKELKPAGMLSYYAQRFSAVEINATFYRMPTEATLEAWLLQVTPGFTFVL